MRVRGGVHLRGWEVKIKLLYSKTRYWLLGMADGAM